VKLNELEQMSVDDLWNLHVEIGEALAVRLTAEKKVLEERLKQFAAQPMLKGASPLRSVGNTRLSFQNFAIRMTRRKRGPGAANSHAGLPSNSGRAKRWTILELRWLRHSFCRRVCFQ